MRSLIRILAGTALTLTVAACQAEEAPDGQTIEGSLSVIAVDNFEDKTASRDYLLKRQDEPTVALKLSDDMKSSRELESGQRIRVKGDYASGDQGDAEIRRFHVESMTVLDE